MFSVLLSGPCDMVELHDVNTEMLVEFKSQSPYESNQNCDLNFTCPTDYPVIVAVTKFDIEVENDCGYDFVSFDDKKKCGNSTFEYTTTNTTLNIHFHSDVTRTGLGFNLQLGCRGL